MTPIPIPTLNQILDIAIALVAVYATLSCVCSWMNEKVASWLRLRGWNLFKGVLALVDTHDMAASIFNHPLIASSSPKSKTLQSGGTTVEPQIPVQPARSGPQRFWQVFQMKPPSYCDARNFSSSVWQVVANKYPTALLNAAKALPGGLPATPDGQTALAQLVVQAPNQALATLSATVQSMPASDLQEQLLGLLTQAGKDYTGLLAATDGWFNAQMDRVSGWYKRETQWVMAAIALIVVTICGVDSVEVVKILSAVNPDALAQIVQSVDVNKTGNTAAGSIGQVVQSGPIDVTKFVHFATLKDPLANWKAVVADPTTKHVTYRRAPGLLVTFLALLLGGPFWFDALKTLMNVRSAGRKPSRKDQPPQ